MPDVSIQEFKSLNLRYNNNILSLKFKIFCFFFRVYQQSINKTRSATPSKSYTNPIKTYTLSLFPYIADTYLKHRRGPFPYCI